ncbi:hypothetical protein HDU84_000411, partial [Entophlyctis sp. JEL0112]
TNRFFRETFGLWLINESSVHLAPVINDSTAVELIAQTLPHNLKKKLWIPETDSDDGDKNNEDHHEKRKVPFSGDEDSQKLFFAISTTIALLNSYSHAYCNTIFKRVEEKLEGGYFDWDKYVEENLRMATASSMKSPKCRHMRQTLADLGTRVFNTVESIKLLPVEKWRSVEKTDHVLHRRKLNTMPNIASKKFRQGHALVPFDVAVFLRWFVADFQQLAHEFDLGSRTPLYCENHFPLGDLALSVFDETSAPSFAQLFESIPALGHTADDGSSVNDELVWTFEPSVQDSFGYENMWTSLESTEPPHLLLRLFPWFGADRTSTGFDVQYSTSLATKIFVDCSYGVDGPWYGCVLTANLRGKGLQYGE